MKLDMKRRFAFIETRLYWGEGVTAAELGEAFGISRQSAQAVIAAYRKEHPGQLLRDKKGKRQIPADTFEPTGIRRDTEAFLDYLRGQALLAHYMEDAEWSDVPFVDADRLTRPGLNGETVRCVLGGLYGRRAVAIYYQSKSRRSWREISPHHLVFAANRYHLRAYCHQAQVYLDFTLSRILDTGTAGNEWVSGEGDVEWREYQTLIFNSCPLDSDAQAAFLLDYPDAVNGRLSIHCRRALAHYVIREMTRADAPDGKPRWKLVTSGQ
jgi:hypothetical protein